jgi:hypothetical protein
MLRMDVEREGQQRYEQLQRCCRYAGYFRALLQPFPQRRS